MRRLTAVETVHTTSGRFDLCGLLRAPTTLDLDTTPDKIDEIDGVQALETLIDLSTRLDRQS